MAKVKGYLRLQGSMGETTFLKNGTAPSYRAQDKLVVSKDRFKTSPSFARVRENASEFSRAGAGAKLIRNATSSIWQDVKDKTRNKRMLVKAIAIIKSDIASARGHRNMVDGDITLLNRFSFVAGVSLIDVFKPMITSTIDRVAGHVNVAIPSFVPSMELTPPPGATHFQILTAGCEMDFEMDTFKSDLQKTAELPISTTPTGAINLSCTVPANSTRPLIQVFGVRFYQQVAGLMYAVLDAGYNPALILDATKV